MNISDLTVKGEKVETLTVSHFFEYYSHRPIIDVRSPGEFQKGHIPGAFNVPLFNNEERAIVGTTYKQKSREEAIEIGYAMVVPKMQGFLDKSREIAPSGEVTVHCWRGGMRSASFARHLSEAGFQKVSVIEGGYKAFRNFVLDFFTQTFHLKILGGYTGSGKTEILKHLHELGEQVVDLEGLANHRGSAFGAIDLPPQPSVEHFENMLFYELNQLDLNKTIWVEDESKNIGSVFIPPAFFKQMKSNITYFLNISREERAKHLKHTYGNLSIEGLAESIQKISKRMGYNNAKYALDYLAERNAYKVVMLCLEYYDKLYSKGLSMRDQEKVVEISLETTDHYKNALAIKNRCTKN